MEHTSAASVAGERLPFADTHYQDLLRKTLDVAGGFLEGLSDRPVGRPVDFPVLLKRMGGPLPFAGEDPASVIEHLATAADRGLVATAGPRYFGFVTGGSLPVAVAADWLASVWDQNAFNYLSSPAAAAAEEVARQWLVDLFGLSPDTSAGFTTGATMASFTALAAARHALLRRMSWDVEAQGLFGAPPITVVTSEESHVTIFAALQMLGLGRERVVKVPTDGQGRMRTVELRSVLAGISSPVLVCAQAGNVNTGGFDPIAEIVDVLRERTAWLHVDGAFGLWAAASAPYRHLTAGIEHADSLTVDGHKWLNVPYDCGLVFVRDRAAHHAAMTLYAPYYGPGVGVARDNFNWVPEASRRARGFAVYAVLRALGRDGIAQMVERCCRLARRMAERLAAVHGIEILNDVVLNQVLVRFSPPPGESGDEFTGKVIRRVQEDGVCWVGGTFWHDIDAMRISISNWSTTEADIDVSAEAILRSAAPEVKA
jgi:glutamate/tyrosine decarboxylase-like PLP-dependent enzyme